MAQVFGQLEMTNGPNLKRPKLDPGQILERVGPNRRKKSGRLNFYPATNEPLSDQDVPKTIAVAAETRHQKFWLGICDAK